MQNVRTLTEIEKKKLAPYVQRYVRAQRELVDLMQMVYGTEDPSLVMDWSTDTWTITRPATEAEVESLAQQIREDMRRANTG